MVPEFKNMGEVLHYVKETMILDVSELVSPLNTPEVLQALYPPKPGIYLQTDGTCIHEFRTDAPIFDMNAFSELNKNTVMPSMYAFRSMTPEQRRYFENMPLKYPHPLTTLEQVLTVEGGICDHKGELLSKLSRLKRIRRYLTDTPSYQKQLTAFARIMICRILMQECPHARVGLLDNAANVVRREYHQLFDSGAFDNLFTNTRMSIRRLIDQDVFNIFTIKDMQHHVLIAKSMDYRIFEYYQMKFAEIDDD